MINNEKENSLEMEKLIQKLDNEMKHKSRLILPDCDLDLDLDFNESPETVDEQNNTDNNNKMDNLIHSSKNNNDNVENIDENIDEIKQNNNSYLKANNKNSLLNNEQKSLEIQINKNEENKNDSIARSNNSDNKITNDNNKEDHNGKNNLNETENIYFDAEEFQNPQKEEIEKLKNEKNEENEENSRNLEINLIGNKRNSYSIKLNENQPEEQIKNKNEENYFLIQNGAGEPIENSTENKKTKEEWNEKQSLSESLKEDEITKKEETKEKEINKMEKEKNKINEEDKKSKKHEEEEKENKILEEEKENKEKEDIEKIENKEKNENNKGKKEKESQSKIEISFEDKENISYDKKYDIKKEKENTNIKSDNTELKNNSQLISNKFKNSKLFSSLPEEEKEGLLSLIKEVQNFRENEKKINDNIDEYPLITLDLFKEEKTLDNLIPNFSDKIKNENKDNIEKRKRSFMNHIYFEDLIDTSPLLNLIPECEIPHIDLMKNIYNEQELKNIPEIDDNYESIIFPKNSPLISEYYNPIGELQDIKSLLYKYKIDINSKIVINCYTNFCYWRNIQADGNSFYRTFMFSLIELYILYKMEEKLRELISEITSDNLITIYKEYNINYEMPFYILGAILQLLSKDKIEKSYELFLKSYLLEDRSFDKVLIVYLKYISFLYVDEVIKLSQNEEFQDEKFDTSSINVELIKEMDVEPQFFIICLMPYLFDINFIIFYLDKDLTQSKDGITNFIDEDNEEVIPIISIGFFYSSYFNIYSPNFLKGNLNICDINDIFKSKLNELSKLTLELESPIKCQICGCQKFIIFFRQKFQICRNCLEKYINDICGYRKDALINDNYIGQEYYSRAICLKDNYIVNDYEFIEIKEEYNIINYLQHRASIICSKCHESFDKKNLNNLKCKCLLCDRCLEKMILKLTNGLKILNSFEKKNLEKTFCSSCKGIFSYEDAIDHLKDIKDIDREKAIKRMNNYVSTLCLVCGDNLRENRNFNLNNMDTSNENITEDDNNNNISNKTEKYKMLKNFKKIKIRKENDRSKGIDYVDIDHIICINCFGKGRVNFPYDENKKVSNKKKDKNEKIKNKQNKEDIINIEDFQEYSRDKNKKEKYYIDFEEGECFCFICEKKHFLSENIKIGGCCSNGCEIY